MISPLEQKIEDGEYQIIANSIFSKLDDSTAKAIYRAGFIGVDHSKAKSKNDTLVDRARILSSGMKAFSPQEWEIDGVEYTDTSYSCVCGKPNLKKVYKLTNKHTGHMLTVGGSCLEHHFFKIPREDVFDYLRGSARSSRVYLGKKHDALLLFSLGFKDAMLYFEMRAHHRLISDKMRFSIKKMLGFSLGDFNAPFWEKRLYRGRRLLEYIRTHEQRERMRKYHEQQEGRSKPMLSAEESRLQDRKRFKEESRRRTKPKYIPINPLTGAAEQTSHEPKLLEGTLHKIDVIDCKWFCRCDDFGSLYFKDNGDKKWMECEYCKNAYHL